MLNSLINKHDLLLSSSLNMAQSMVQNTVKDILHQKKVQSAEEAAQQRERLLAHLFAKSYTKDKQKVLQEIHQDALDLQQEVNGQTVKNQASLKQSVDDFVRLTSSELADFEKVRQFIEGANPEVSFLSKFCFIKVAEAKPSNCKCVEVSRYPISSTQILINYECTCKVMVQVQASQKEIAQHRIRSMMSHQKLLNIIAQMVKPSIRFVPARNHANMGKVTVDPRTGNRKITDFHGNQQTVVKGSQANKEEIVHVNGRQVKVKRNGDGIPDFKPYTTYETKLPRKDWFQSDKTQFSMLNKGLHKKISADPSMRNQIAQTALNELRYGNPTSNGKERIKTFLKNIPASKPLFSPLDIVLLENGQGLTPQTWKQINSDPVFRQQIIQLNEAAIQKGQTPLGYVWHHHEAPGKMQLVEKKVHDAIPHIGGRSIWGGGESFRK
jgi:hypothetical protein